MPKKKPLPKKDFKYPKPVVRWNGLRHSYQRFHESIFEEMMNPKAEFFVDKDIQYLPIGLWSSKYDVELLVLARRSNLFLHGFGIDKHIMLQTNDAGIEGATNLGYTSNYLELSTRGFGFGDIETGTDTLLASTNNLVMRIKSINPKDKTDKQMIYNKMKPDILVLCFFLSESVRFRPVHHDAFSTELGPRKRISGWSGKVINYWEAYTKEAHHYEGTSSQFMPSSFVQTLDDIKLVDDLTADQLDLVNGKRLEGEHNHTNAVERLRACSKSCAFAVKLRWLFMDVEKNEKKIVDIFRVSGNKGMTAKAISDKLKYEYEMSQLIWVLRQLVKRRILKETANLFYVLNQGSRVG